MVTLGKISTGTVSPTWSQGGPDSPFYDYHSIQMGQHLDLHMYFDQRRQKVPVPVI